MSALGLRWLSNDAIVRNPTDNANDRDHWIEVDDRIMIGVGVMLHHQHHHHRQLFPKSRSNAPVCFWTFTLDVWIGLFLVHWLWSDSWKAANKLVSYTTSNYIMSDRRRSKRAWTRMNECKSEMKCTWRETNDGEKTCQCTALGRTDALNWRLIMLCSAPATDQVHSLLVECLELFTDWSVTVVGY